MPSTTTPAISSIAAPDAYLQSGSSPPPTTIDREVLAQRVIAGIGSIATKLSELEPDIRQLWIEFKNLPKGETILGCATKKQFCETHLHRTPRAVRYLLNGDSNPNYVPVAQRGEIISPVPALDEPATPAVEAAPIITDAINFPTKPKQLHIVGDENAPIFWKTLGNKLNALLPSYSDGSEHTMATLLEQAYNEPLSTDPTVLRSVVVMLKNIAADYAEHARKLEARIKFAEIVQVEEQAAPPSDGVSIPTSPLQCTEASC